METKEIGTRHGAAVRRAAGLTANLTVALGKDVALNARRLGGYAAGFARGLLGSRATAPNA
jgi:hypothetical protein